MTDIEGSTQLLQALPEDYPALLGDHYRLLRDAFSAAGGTEVSTEGDALFFVFPSAPSAVRAALDGQRRLAAHTWPSDAVVRVRMGVHTGQGTRLGDDYVGLDVHRAARITNAAHGGQVLLSDASRALVEGDLPEGAGLRDLGEHRLKDLVRPEHLVQLLASDLASDFPPLRSVAGHPNNLPVPVSMFIGRVAEKQQLLELVRAARLVTLTGPGGTGKTRLSLEVAAMMLDDFADGVWFVPLAEVGDATMLVPSIAATLHVRDAPGRSPAERILEHVTERTLLLVLDNFEHLIAASTDVADLLARAPRLKILVTSREPLRIVGEQEFPLRPLALPGRDVAAGLDALGAFDAIALFVQRARSVRPDFSLTVENASAVTEICTRLDGLPLAIELAAARLRLFEPHELRSQLDSRLSLLAGGRDMPERQRTLRGAIDWSHDLLPQPEQALFRRLAVFAGGCTLDAVEAVCRPAELGIDVIDGVSSLRDKSLLRRDDVSSGELRLTMLETIRDYGRERLKRSGEAREVELRHATYFLAIAEHAATLLLASEQDRWLEALDRDLDNIRAVIRWALDSGETDIGLRLASSLLWFWLYRNLVKEGRRHLTGLLAVPGTGSRAVRAGALAAAAELVSWQGDYDAMRPLAHESIAIYRELGDVEGVAGQLRLLGYADIMSAPSAALESFRESIAAYREAGAPPMMGGALVGTALVEMQLRDLDAAASHLEEASRVLGRAGDEQHAYVPIGLLGLVERLRGNIGEARRRYRDVLVRSQQLGSHLSLAMAVESLADLAIIENRPEHATVLAASVLTVKEELGGAPSLALTGIPDVLERARAALGAEQFERALARGRSTPLDEVALIALDGAD
jgi:predicted ATPase/class 3 adenylate cyclase